MREYFEDVVKTLFPVLVGIGVIVFIVFIVSLFSGAMSNEDIVKETKICEEAGLYSDFIVRGPDTGNSSVYNVVCKKHEKNG
tara:strand:- start:394 stop:639 length:246 start_codon:yes stop_codon:yes gene_type:complete